MSVDKCRMGGIEVENDESECSCEGEREGGWAFLPSRPGRGVMAVAIYYKQLFCLWLAILSVDA